MVRETDTEEGGDPLASRRGGVNNSSIHESWEWDRDSITCGVMGRL